MRWRILGLISYLLFGVSIAYLFLALCRVAIFNIVFSAICLVITFAMARGFYRIKADEGRFAKNIYDEVNEIFERRLPILGEDEIFFEIPVISPGDIPKFTDGNGARHTLH